MLRSFEINESSDYDIILKKIVDDLNLNYEPTVGTYRQGGEYFERPIVTVKADNEKIAPKRLFEYLKYKYGNVSEAFLKQVILDWVNGNIKDYSLSKVVSM